MTSRVESGSRPASGAVKPRRKSRAKKSVSVAIANHRGQRFQQDLDVKCERPRLDIKQVVLGSLLDRRLTAETVHLCPAGHARLFHVPLAVARHQVGELRHELWSLWPRANQAHLADQYVDQLRELVQAETAD